MLKPITVPEDMRDLVLNGTAEEQYAFGLQEANIRTANALTAIAIHIGAMTPDGEFVSPELTEPTTGETELKDESTPDGG